MGRQMIQVLASCSDAYGAGVVAPWFIDELPVSFNCSGARTNQTLFHQRVKRYVSLIRPFKSRQLSAMTRGGMPLVFAMEHFGMILKCAKQCYRRARLLLSASLRLSKSSTPI